MGLFKKCYKCSFEVKRYIYKSETLTVSKTMIHTTNLGLWELLEKETFQNVMTKWSTDLDNQDELEETVPEKWNPMVLKRYQTKKQLL